MATYVALMVSQILILKIIYQYHWQREQLTISVDKEYGSAC